MTKKITNSINYPRQLCAALYVWFVVNFEWPLHKMFHKFIQINYFCSLFIEKYFSYKRHCRLWYFRLIVLYRVVQMSSVTFTFLSNCQCWKCCIGISSKMLRYKGNLIKNFFRLILEQDVHWMPFFMGDAFLELCTVRSSISIRFYDHLKFPPTPVWLGWLDPGFQKAP